MTKEDVTIDIENITIAEVATTFPQAPEILGMYNLDYCCGGKTPFAEACKAAGVEATLVLQQIRKHETEGSIDGRIQFGDWSIPLLVDFIVQHHHAYVRKNIPLIQAVLDKICEVHCDDSPFLLDVHENFDRLADELTGHMPKEEKILFPAALKLHEDIVVHGDQQHILMRLESPIAVMEHEHDEAGRLIKSIRSLTSGYTPPDFACPTYKLAYTMLQQFDADLMQHIHLENNILFPRILETQARFLKYDRAIMNQGGG